MYLLYIKYNFFSCKNLNKNALTITNNTIGTIIKWPLNKKHVKQMVKPMLNVLYLKID